MKLAKGESDSQLSRMTQCEQDTYEMHVRSANIVSIIELKSVGPSLKYITLVGLENFLLMSSYNQCYLSLDFRLDLGLGLTPRECALFYGSPNLTTDIFGLIIPFFYHMPGSCWRVTYEVSI